MKVCDRAIIGLQPIMYLKSEYDIVILLCAFVNIRDRLLDQDQDRMKSVLRASRDHDHGLEDYIPYL